MQYLDDIIELIEDLPCEVERRFEQIRRWDTEVEKLRVAASDLQNRVFEDHKNVDNEEKPSLCYELAEIHRLVRDITERKLDLAARTERLMAAIADKVQESAYHCKIELEVDNPGCTELIEQNFCQSLGLRPSSTHITDCSMEFEPLDRMGGLSGDLHVQNRDVLKERTNKGKGDQNVVPTSTSGSNFGKKYKKRKDPHNPAPMTAYMRKKIEKNREKQKVQETHVRREQERKRDNSVSVPQLPQPPSRAESTMDCATAPSCDMDDDLAWSGGLPGSDDDFDPNEVLDLFPIVLPSPPRELMESLKEDFVFDEEMNLSSPSSPSSSRPSSSLVPSSVKYKGERMRHDSGSQLGDYGSEKKRKNIMFSSVSDTSMHGRPRKLTDRAVELLQLEREKLRKKEDDEDKWCICGDISSGEMIQCDGSECAISWFHFDCMGLTCAPAGAWFCPTCAKGMSRPKPFSN
ncbi:unnamed protein product [Auanema sp. JU1783]|nr:unnamed protein product [Auanema sp. JU1783]